MAGAKEQDNIEVTDAVAATTAVAQNDCTWVNELMPLEIATRSPLAALPSSPSPSPPSCNAGLGEGNPKHPQINDSSAAVSRENTNAEISSTSSTISGTTKNSSLSAAEAPASTIATATTEMGAGSLSIVGYKDERQLDAIMSLVDRDLSEPYSIFTYRYFLHNWPNLCFVARVGERTVGSIVCKAERELAEDPYTGYIAMLAVDTTYRKHGIGTALASKAIEAMRDLGCDEVVLETEVTNGGALNLYTKLGFSRNERLIKYYLNGVDAFRLKLWFR